MRTTVLLLLCLLLTTSFGLYSMNNTNDKEIGPLVNHTWYNLLPQKVIQERNTLLNILAPPSNGSFLTTHALQIGRVHLLKGRLGHY